MIAHLPALRALADDYVVAGVANTTLASAQAAAAECGVPHAFGRVAGLYESLADDLCEGTPSAQSFDTAVANHRLIAAIGSAASTGLRARPEDM